MRLWRDERKADREVIDRLHAHALYRLRAWLGVKGTCMGYEDFLLYTQPAPPSPEQIWARLCTIFDSHNAMLAAGGADEV